MFNFQKEVIINSLLLDDGVTERFLGSNNMLMVRRCADYKASNIEDGTIYCTPSKVGENATVSITAPTAVGTYRVELTLGLVGKYYADYANPWSVFEKPFTTEFEVTNVADALTNLQNAIKLVLPSDYPIFSIEQSGSVLVLKCIDNAVSVKSGHLYTIEDVDSTYTDTTLTEVSGAVVITDNEVEIGSGTWLIENLRFPTRENRTYLAVGSEEMPISNAYYTQYSFQYISPRNGGGLSAVGQMTTTMTTHTFYVLDSLVADFNAAIANAGIALTVNGESVVGTPISLEDGTSLTTEDGTDLVLEN